MSGDRPFPADEGLTSEDERLSRLVVEFEKAMAEGLPTESLERQIVHDCGTRAESALQGLKWLYALDRSAADATEGPPSPDLDATQPVDSVWMFGRFRVLERLGAGGHGIVFRVLDPKLNREAALKLPRPDVHWQPGMGRRFLKEARAAASLDHPHVLPIYDAGRTDGVHYILSAYCCGPSLSQWLAEQKKLDKPVNPRLAARWLAQIADGVDYAHSKGVAHRDLKPANIMLEPIASDGLAVPEEDAFRPRISDFGLSKSGDQDNSATETGVIQGTLAYMAPEQAQGTRDVNVTALDIYALGAILFEMLTGRPPLVGQNQIDLLRRIGVEDPPLPSSLRAEVPRDLEAICMKCLDREPSRRYQTARELSHDLASFLAGEPVVAQNVRRSSHYWKSISARQLPAWTIFSLLGTLIVVVGLSGWQYIRTNAEREKLTKAMSEVQRNLVREQTDSESQSKVAASQDRTLDEIYASDMQRANRIWLDSRTLERDFPYAAADIKEILMRHVPAAGARDRRGFEWYYLWRCCEPERFATPSRRVGEFAGHTSDVYSVEFTPDGKRLVSASGDKTIRVWDVASRESLLTLIGHTADVNSISVSGDGKRLASASDDGTVKTWDVDSGENLHTFTGHQSPVVSVAFHAHFPLIFSGDHNGVVKVWDLERKSEIRSLQAHGQRIQSLFRYPSEYYPRSSSRDLEFLTCGDDSTAKVWSLHKTSETGTAPTNAFELGYGLEFFRNAFQSPLFATIGYPQTVRSKVELFRKENTNRIAFESAARLQSGGFTVDDSQFMSAGRETPVRAIDIATRKSWNLTEARSVWSLGVSRDGRYFATGEKDGIVSLWDCAITPQHTILSEQLAYGTALKFSEDGRRMFVRAEFVAGAEVTFNRCVGVWDLTTSPPLARESPNSSISTQRANAVFCNFTPDERDVIVGSYSPEGRWTCSIFDLESGSEKSSYPLPVHQILAQIECDDARLYCLIPMSDRMEIMSFDLHSGNQLDEFSISGPSVQGTLSADGKLLAIENQNEISIYDVHSHDRRISFASPFPQITGLAFSPLSEYLAITIAGRKLRVVGTGDGSTRCDLLGDGSAPIEKVIFSPDGRRVITGGGRASVIDVWSMPAGRHLLSLKLPGPNNYLTDLCFSPDGKNIAAIYRYLPLDPELPIRRDDPVSAILWRITGDEAPPTATP